MSTSAIIKVEGIDFVSVYKHWDGYPSATLPWLESFNTDFAKHRKDDPAYKFAQLLRSSERDAEKFNLDDSIHTGWGICSGEETSDYTYILHEDGTVTYRN